MLSYIQNNPQETQRLVGVKYDQLEQLMGLRQKLNPNVAQTSFISSEYVTIMG